MQQYQHILLVSHGVEYDLSVLSQALILTRNNQAHLTVLIVRPPFVPLLDAYQEAYRLSLIDEFNAQMRVIQQELGLNEHDHVIELEFGSNTEHAIKIISRVIRDKHDLLIKAVESTAKKSGFKAIDMELVRKCPCPIWLHRPKNRVGKNRHIAVAVDPQSQEKMGKELAINLLKTADTLAKTSDNKLAIITCWDFPLEISLRSSPAIQISADHVKRMIQETEDSARQALEVLVMEAKLESPNQIYLQRGQADEVIPHLITSLDIDIVVMGTVGRSGVMGFLIGNTAENVLPNVSCSLVALKPKGFISSVKI